MKRIEPMGSKFQRVEIAMRQTLRSYSKVMDEFDIALVGKRTTLQEREWLHSLKKEWNESHKLALAITLKLFDT